MKGGGEQAYRQCYQPDFFHISTSVFDFTFIYHTQVRVNESIHECPEAKKLDNYQVGVLSKMFSFMTKLEEDMERTFAIIKPDAVERKLAGKILDRIESKGFGIVGMKKIKLSKCQAEGFYYVHKERPFFNDLCTFMSRSPVIVLVLEKENAIADWRTLMGATNPANAEAGTIRKDFAVNIEENSSHGSDAPETAAFEIPYFFSALELV
jgi:nucleoside-diphosphate kinase